MPKVLNFKQELVGCFGQPVAENPTQAMVEAAFRHHGMDVRYINCEVAPEDLGDAVRGARAMGWAGFNCSMPHKVTVIEHLDGLGESARIMGAVNTAVRRGDKFIGENTDGKGFLKSLMEVVDPAGKRVVVFGAGGAARAIAVELALAGAAAITVVNRSRERGQVLVERARVGVEILACPELQRVDEDRHHHDRAGNALGRANQRQVALVQRTHGGHEGDPAPAGTQGPADRRDIGRCRVDVQFTGDELGRVGLGHP